jgi:hypothetical protein
MTRASAPALGAQRPPKLPENEQRSFHAEIRDFGGP